MKMIKGIWSTLGVIAILAVMIGFKHTEVMDPSEKTAIANEMKKVSEKEQAEARQAAMAKQSSAKVKQPSQNTAGSNAE
ncbi:hypothetical protein CEF21_19780 [Bacillus sp. FJAT-42376]|uniref:hypothetical protein n=1 Tax=Bacillus sp. FJAT-42376 TaxID=2014076 RepID=UPI000F510BCF|nr:hypothetical protein [Bacillus sp. FJAT-42376]AZB44350.1 hypothetical protein CEF21_19780 [Bacillus sp. FJAT-42376]